MRYKLSIAIALLFLMLSCTRDYGTYIPPTLPPATGILLKDMVMSHLPSPYYHFEYDTAGKIIKASFSGGLRIYDVLYQEGRIHEMRNNTAVNKNRLLYFYNIAGQVDRVDYINDSGSVFRRGFMTYSGNRLQSIEWALKVSAGFFAERTVTFAYKPDGNLLNFTSERFPFENQTEVLYNDHFEEYDSNVNTDGFSVFHEDNEHLLLLPGVQFQKNNPGKITRTGNGNNYIIHYVYTYNNKNAPLTKTGDFVYTSGPHSGERFTLNDSYSYY